MILVIAAALSLIALLAIAGRGSIPKTVKRLGRRADSGNAEAIYRLGRISDPGSSDQLAWYRRAANRGHGEARTMLGYWHEKGVGPLEANPVQAYFWYSLGDRILSYSDPFFGDRNRLAETMTPDQIAEAERLLDAGHRDASRRLPALLPWVAAAMLGMSAPALAGIDEAIAAYTRGDYEAAHREFLPLAQAGDAGAQYTVGVMYSNGHGVPQDKAEAIKWYRMAAKQGLAQAQYSIGVFYNEGRGVPQDYAEAMTWWRKAAAQGEAKAQHNLGVSYRDGVGVPQDYAKAMKWFRKAAGHGTARAQYNIGVLFQKGQGVPRDYAEAVKWYTKAANQGDEFAENNLAFMYQKGLGVPRDYAEAVKWYRKAAGQGQARSQHNLAVMYDRGHGVPQDDAEAVTLYTMAANQGFADSQINLGFIYREGQGVPQDDVQAHFWWSLAAAQGIRSAENRRDILARKMSSDDISKAQKMAREWKPKPSPPREVSIGLESFAKANADANTYEEIARYNMMSRTVPGALSKEDEKNMLAAHVEETEKIGEECEAEVREKNGLSPGGAAKLCLCQFKLILSIVAVERLKSKGQTYSSPALRNALRRREKLIEKCNRLKSELGWQPPKPAAPTEKSGDASPPCGDVGGYEAYMKRTGSVCRLD